MFINKINNKTNSNNTVLIQKNRKILVLLKDYKDYITKETPPYYSIINVGYKPLYYITPL